MMCKTLPLSNGGCVSMIEVGQGAPLVLIHGVGLRAEAWGPQLSDLSREYHVIALDMPGHGGSDKLAKGALLPDYVAWAAGVLRDLNLGPVAVAGHSMGALIALGLAVEHSDLIKGAAILNGVYQRSDAARHAVLARAAEIAQGQIHPQAPLSRWFDGDDPARAQVQHWLETVDLSGYGAAYQAFALGDSTYAGRLGAIECPSLVLTADGDANSTAEMAHAMAGQIENASVVVIQGHRHMVNLTAPDRVSSALKVWLKEVWHD
jgi:(E)-2-((N-methylformamido)methylene)succinate hydrolase